ncbi:hypothetical protein I4U23_017654 [Adineta vaga]|nr:hypothetical protein I4U23_017654 [Adineta vaga]
MNVELEFRTRPGRKRKTKQDDKCRVCNDPAIGLNFGVQTCSPCKAFFRRNAVKLGTTEFQCRDDGDCPVTSDTRRQCNCCRLAKCFRVGMNPKAIRTDDQRQERLQLIEYNRQKRSEQNNDTEYSMIISNKQSIRPINLLCNSTLKQSILSPDDHIRLTNIYQSYDQMCTSYTYNEHLNMPVNETLTLRKFLNASSNIYIGLISFLQSIPEFRSIPVDTKIFLVKSNFNQVLFKHSALITKTITPHLMKDSPVLLHLFPKDLYMNLCERGHALLAFVHDPILLKLFFVILMLSTYLNIPYEFDPMINTDINVTRTVLSAQNIYVELLWRYILSRSTSYRQSVQLLTSLISRTLNSQIIQDKMNDFIRKSISHQQQQLEPIIEALWTSNDKTIW